MVPSTDETVSDAIAQQGLCLRAAGASSELAAALGASLRICLPLSGSQKRRLADPHTISLRFTPTRFASHHRLLHTIDCSTPSIAPHHRLLHTIDCSTPSRFASHHLDCSTPSCCPPSRIPPPPLRTTLLGFTQRHFASHPFGLTSMQEWIER